MNKTLMAPPETSTEGQTVEFAKGYMPSLARLSKDHPARALWDETRQAGRDGDVRRLEEFHAARIRWVKWKGASLAEATEGARLGLRDVIAHEVTDPVEAIRLSELIDDMAGRYEER